MTVLLVDDDPAVGAVLSALLRQEGIAAREVRSGKEALRVLEDEPFDLVVTDLRMPEMTGMDLLASILEKWPEQQVVMLTAHGSVPTAVEAMRLGATDFLLKPFDAEEVVYVIRKAIAKGSHLAARLGSSSVPRSGSVGRSRAMQEVDEIIDRVAASGSTVLVLGESGTGKELVAAAIHERSKRKGPLIKVHCAALPEALLESELFGYEKGAFTGAQNRKPGRLELAHEGTLFLDEIGDVPLQVQVKLLRILQERAFERVGGTQTIKVDVRFVAATHRDLGALIAKGEFREDLFYRLNVVPIHLPPLRDREGEIARLALEFCAQQGALNGRPGTELDSGAVAVLSAERWPGNVRQLQNFVERLVVLSSGPVIRRVDVERELSREARWKGLGGSPASPTNKASLDERRRDLERGALVEALERARDNRTLAARLMGISRRTFYNRLREHGIA